MRRVEFEFKKDVRGFALPIVTIELEYRGIIAGPFSATVDTGSAYTMADIEVGRRFFGISDEELRGAERVEFCGMGSSTGVAYCWQLDSLVIESDSQRLRLPEPVVYFTDAALPDQRMLLGQRCALERLVLFHCQPFGVLSLAHP